MRSSQLETKYLTKSVSNFFKGGRGGGGKI